jgi:hypothetical protein
VVKAGLLVLMMAMEATLASAHRMKVMEVTKAMEDGNKDLTVRVGRSLMGEATGRED